MRNKQIKLIYFSFGGSDVREINLSWKNIIGFGIASFTAFLFIVSVFIGLFTDFYHNTQVSHLSQSNEQLMKFLSDVNNKVGSLESQVQDLEKEDDDLRIFVDLPEIDSDVRKLGVGGHDQTILGATSVINGDTRDTAIKVKNVLENLEQRIRVAQTSRQEIYTKYAEDMNEIKHTPSIRPVIGGRYTDRFGLRRDPLLDKIASHHGLDIAASRGTPVYASADGVVIRIVEKYTPNVGYGKMVVIDHGYGFTTKYAHLHKILVKRGQKVTRHTIIGQVGDTGRSTGPHLHYEVLANSKAVNPENYILD